VKVTNLTEFPSAAEQTANLFYDYLFAPPYGQYPLDGITIDYTIHGSEGRFVIPAGVPVEQNRRTNVSGRILVDRTAAGVTVEVADNWAGQDQTSFIGIDISPLAYYYEGGRLSSMYIGELECIGLVFHLDESGEHGLMVSLDEGWNENLSWGWDENESTFSVLKTGATNEDDGAKNLQTLLEVKKGDLSRYSAFTWCTDKGEGWYLPAINEVAMLRQAWNADREAFDSALTIAGGVPIRPTEPNWWENHLFMSSTEKDDNYIWAWDFSSDKREDRLKSVPDRIRAVRRF